MKQLLACTLFILVISCNSNNNKPQIYYASLDTHVPTCSKTTVKTIENLHPHPYTIEFDINKIESEVYDLIFKINLNNGSFFVSPNAKRDFKGKFTFNVDNNSAFIEKGILIEIPLSVEEIDPHPFVNGEVNWVRENTTYIKQIHVNTEDDFEVMGLIQFTIEPRCTLEKIPIIIKRQNGLVKFELFGC